ncbi:His-Xaa-Ser system radical SAM maturase HxsB [Escherichia marmotae]|uniref:His-Xaa-Ser system radical SAM maturase HxsB n=1 Tax=Escherichia marmotae TaxID=1499973 RepID=UPI002E238FB7|nr:His-Xaa-Ser system radical SAM maturase HxsB [Escherichia marmotae]MED8690172.1 His-Xaa-Ser system radical SAM maturase HxsB [Escherichia marmotae]MED9197730.1 His-Xaa-Ser system radical SAM maturase HxsB [Escherichia marmotae]MED9687255.1 His-Xaa-Ser system radical SAM maturase HxsB [Escherichia marmotae]
MELMPFNFDRLPNGRVFISNLAGFHHFINEQELLDLSDEQISAEQSNALESKLFITNESSSAIAPYALSSAFAKRLMNELAIRPIFMIVPTLRCDHTCKYCQVSRASVNASGYDLDPALIPDIISTIKKLSTPPYKIEIQGGEPLLRFDLLQSIYEQCAETLGSTDFEMVVASSLSVLNEDMLEWSRDKNITFSVSLDGEEVVHNSNRILGHGLAYRRTVSGVEAIKRSLGAGRVATVTTVTKDLIRHPESIVQAHLSLGLKDMFIRPVSPYGFAQKASFTFSMDEYFSFYASLIDEILKMNNEGIRVVEHSASIHLKRIFNPGFSGYADLKSPSGVVLNSILFNYDGRVYGSDESRMLQKVNPETEFSAGEVKTLSFSKSPYYNAVLSSSFNFALPGCDTCAYQPFCGADPCQNISVQGEPVGDRSRSTFCQYHKGMFRYLMNCISEGGPKAEMLKGWAYV